MKQPDIDAQLHLLKRMDHPRLASVFIGVLMLCASATSYKAITGNDYGLFFVAVILVVFAWAVGESTPHVRRAVLAIDSANRQYGQAKIWTAIASGDVSYYVNVPVDGQNAWSFQFRPIGWVPVPGLTDAEYRFIDGTPWPVLIITPTGILHPCAKPLPLMGDAAAFEVK